MVYIIMLYLLAGRRKVSGRSLVRRLSYVFRGLQYHFDSIPPTSHLSRPQVALQRGAKLQSLDSMFSRPRRCFCRTVALRKCTSPPEPVKPRIAAPLGP